MCIFCFAEAAGGRSFARDDGPEGAPKIGPERMVHSAKRATQRNSICVPPSSPPERAHGDTGGWLQLPRRVGRGRLPSP